MDTQDITALIAIDLLADFDAVNHQIWLNVLHKFYRINGEALQWFESYWENGSIRVQIDNSFWTV